jgi:hypothetical protein
MVDPLTIYLSKLGISFITGLFISTLILYSRRKKVQDRIVYWVLAIALGFTVMVFVELVEFGELYFFNFFLSFWLIFALAFAFSFYFLRELFYLVTSKNWPTTLGMITQSQIHTNYSHRVNERPVKEFKIKYSYSVNNKEYENELLKFFAYRHIFKVILYWNTSEKPLLPLIEKYQSGEQVTVYYNPRNPLISVLEPGKCNYRPLVAQLIAVLLLAFYLYPNIGPITSISVLVMVLIGYIYFQIVQAWIRVPTRAPSSQLIQPSSSFSPEYSDDFKAPSSQPTQPTSSFSPEYSDDLDRNHFRGFPERVYCENCGTLLQDEKYPCPLCSTQ